jgi:hypothetical protein
MDIKTDAWNNFMDSFDMESDVNNFKYDFKIMTKKYGQAYMEFCKAQWSANDGVQTEEEFMRMNANMPRSFFDKVVKS